MSIHLVSAFRCGTVHAFDRVIGQVAQGIVVDGLVARALHIGVKAVRKQVLGGSVGAGQPDVHIVVDAPSEFLKYPLANLIVCLLNPSLRSRAGSKWRVENGFLEGGRWR